MKRTASNRAGWPSAGFALALVLLSISARTQTPPDYPRSSLSLGPGLTLEVVRLPAGTFQQGSPESEPNRSPDEAVRTVRLSRDFILGRFPVTRAQFERFTQETGFRTEAEKGSSGGFGWDGTGLRQAKQYTWRNPGFPQEPNHPVTLVTFNDALAFCHWLKTKTQREFTLPTEAQWEYACRAGTTTPWHNGNAEDRAGAIAWSGANSGHRTHPVDSTEPNPWGLHIGGNVGEWCLDWFAPYPAGPVSDPLQTRQDLSDKPRRVLRGGSWLRDIQHTRSAARFRNDPGSRNADNGFRVASFDVEPRNPAPAPASLPSGVAQNPTASTPTPPPSPPVARANPPASTAPSDSAQHAPLARPPPFPSTAYPEVHSSRRGLPGILLVAIPLAIVGFAGLAFFVYFVSRIRRSTASTSTPDTAQFSSTSSSGPTTFRNLSPPKVVDDGFWFRADTAHIGQNLLYSYWLHGQLQQGQVLAQPGADGRQFVYTGGRPERITIQMAPDETPDDPTMPLPPHLGDSPPPPSGGAFRSSRQSRSSRFPSAY